jgi:hypothetical protein
MSFAAFSVSLGLFLVSWIPIQSQETVEIREITIRGYLHDPVNPPTEPWIFKHPEGTGGDGTEINWAGTNFTKPVTVKVVNNRIHLFRGPKDLMAGATVAQNLRKALVLIIPAADPQAKNPYRMIIQDDSPSAFPFGTSKVANLIGADAALQAGELNMRLPSGKVTAVPLIQKLETGNFAQVSFHVKSPAGWYPIRETRLRFSKNLRRFYIIYSTPGSKHPMIESILDYAPPSEQEISRQD